MTRMLDVLEAFINIHGYTYLRLDGATRIDDRQLMMDNFNNNDKIFLFILSTRSGGVGINLTGADTVIFYDSDWNPSLDAQAQDRAHRIGQTREVHIYRLVSQHTVEENILKKAMQKRSLENLAIHEGEFTTDFYTQSEFRDMFKGTGREPAAIEAADADVDADADADADAPPAGEQSDAAVRAALLDAEDGDDRAAMAALQREQAGDEAEFSQTAVELDQEAVADVAPAVAAQAQAAIPDGGFSWEDQLSAVERFAMRYLEVVNPIVSKAQLDQMHAQVEHEQKAWEDNKLAQIQAEDEARDRVEKDPGAAMFYDPTDASATGSFAEVYKQVCAQKQQQQPTAADPH